MSANLMIAFLLTRPTVRLMLSPRSRGFAAL